LPKISINSPSIFLTLPCMFFFCRNNFRYNFSIFFRFAVLALFCVSPALFYKWADVESVLCSKNVVIFPLTGVSGWWSHIYHQKIYDFFQIKKYIYVFFTDRAPLDNKKKFKKNKSANLIFFVFFYVGK